MAQKLKKKDGTHNKNAFDSPNVESLIESATPTKASFFFNVILISLSIYFCFSDDEDYECWFWA